MISYWGIDHGDVVSKAEKKDRFNGHGEPTLGRYASAWATGGLHGAFAGNKGSKLRATGNEVGGQTGGGYAGRLAGVGLSAATKGKVKAAGAANALGAGGGVGGSMWGVNRNQRKGYLRPQKKDAV